MTTTEIVLKQILERIEKEIIKAYARVEALEFMRSYIESHYDICKEENQKKNEAHHSVSSSMPSGSAEGNNHV